MVFKTFILRLVLILGICLSLTTPSFADSARIAVASNFAPAMKQLKQIFESQSPHRIKLAFGSTGKQYAQILHGAPFDAFFAADTRRPALLQESGHIIKGSRFTYALGHLVLWSPDKTMVKPSIDSLDNDQIKFIAIANPKLAPYGLAAKETLEQFKRYQTFKSKFVYGENISQTYQFVASGNAQIGLIALSLLKQPNKPMTGSYWVIPQEHYPPIAQQAVRLTNNTAAFEFIKFVQSAPAKRIIHDYGYSLPTTIN
jgi:molybdate transport system substrate-binding protein